MGDHGWGVVGGVGGLSGSKQYKTGGGWVVKVGGGWVGANNMYSLAQCHVILMPALTVLFY